MSSAISGEIVSWMFGREIVIRKGQQLAKIYADIYSKPAKSGWRQVNQQQARVGGRKMNAQLPGLNASMDAEQRTRWPQKTLLTQK